MDIEIDKVATKRSLTKRLLRWSIGIAVGVTAAFFAYRYIVHKSSTAENRAANEKAKVVKPVTITTARVSSRSVRHSVDVVGALYGFEEIVISSNVEGHIKRVVAEVGDRVDSNSKLAVNESNAPFHPAASISRQQPKQVGPRSGERGYSVSAILTRVRYSNAGFLFHSGRNEQSLPTHLRLEAR